MRGPLNVKLNRRVLVRLNGEENSETLWEEHVSEPIFYADLIQNDLGTEPKFARPSEKNH
jgi:hypothetical protein